jgi:tetratricopeptide (TPR) repeat protein
MSDQKESKAAAGEIKPDRPAPSVGSRKKTQYLIGGVFVIALVIGMSTLAYMIHAANKPPAKPIVATAHLTAQQQSDYLAYKGDYSGAQATVAGEIAKAPNATDKAGLYLQQASIAMNAKNYTDAKKYAQAAEALQPSSNSAGLLGDIAALTGDKAAATSDYQEAIDRLDKNSSRYNTARQDYQARIQELGQ